MELIQELCIQAGLQYRGVGLRYNGKLPAGAFVRVIDPSGQHKTYSFPQVYALAKARTNDRPTFPRESSSVFLRSATLSQIADELDRRATLACRCAPINDRPFILYCTECHGTGRVPWPELQEVSATLHDLVLGIPF